jgi:uncharacterized protein
MKGFVPSARRSGRGMLPVMDFNGSPLEHLPRDECMRLLASVPVGRIVYTRQALPAVALVKFAMLDGDIFIRADAGGELAAAARGAVVAFEADSVDTVGHTGWSVTVVGHSRAVAGSEQIQDLERIAHAPWAPVKQDQYIRVSSTIVHGRRLNGT